MSTSSIDVPAYSYCFISLMIGLAVLRYADDEKLPLVASIPISLYGFFIAATWIDTIADALVGLLQFLGAISRIPSSILGLTVLAWGNSMGDVRFIFLACKFFYRLILNVLTSNLVMVLLLSYLPTWPWRGRGCQIWPQQVVLQALPSTCLLGQAWASYACNMNCIEIQYLLLH
jgi:hypothetical protein